MDEELKACPFCGETLRINNARLAVHSRNSECLLRQQPIVVDDKDQVERWNTRTTHPAAASVGGGEAVEVVAWQDAENPLYTTAERRVMHDWAGNGYPIVELMTVAQHQRILAATTRPAGQVSENVNALSATALRRAARFLESIDNGCNEVKTLRSLLAKSEGAKK